VAWRRASTSTTLSTYDRDDEAYWVGFAEMLLGYLDRAEDDPDTAERHFRASLTAFRGIDAVMMAATLLNAFADLALRRGRHERALRLAGAYDALREPFGERSPLEQASTVDVRGELRGVVDDGRAAAVYDAGRAMALDEAIEYALEEDATACGS
jgi:hypothetical protein